VKSLTSLARYREAEKKKKSEKLFRRMAHLSLPKNGGDRGKTPEKPLIAGKLQSRPETIGVASEKFLVKAARGHRAAP